ncbi:hypothetical protein [Terricaulis silvestris]|uniref:Uncharacterized protein n=1 Tax=Terricaulis silvestris TaxID=2686094 RepID=A0A6I6MJB1_9CAUL|nr:hypothetical protein [Terricaulis silvestris]QGZ95240.1 hypothetical protein DSM104635_02084 [Terricaulis silvestris]
MNVIDGWSLLAQIALWVVIAIALAVAFTYFSRPRTRALYPGGNRRYLAALTVQAAGFMIPIPVVIILLIGRLPAGIDVMIAVAVGIGVIFLLRALPATGPLLKDLHRARVEAVMERLGPRPPESKP